MVSTGKSNSCCHTTISECLGIEEPDDELLVPDVRLPIPVTCRVNISPGFACVLLRRIDINAIVLQCKVHSVSSVDFVRPSALVLPKA